MQLVKRYAAKFSTFFHSYIIQNEQIADYGSVLYEVRQQKKTPADQLHENASIRRACGVSIKTFRNDSKGT